KKQMAVDVDSLQDFTPTDFSGQTDELLTDSQLLPTTPAPPQHASKSVTTTVEDSGGDVEVPDFSAKTMRDVSQMCVRLGLDPVLVGSNRAVDQTPAAGSHLRPGAKVTVQFGMPIVKALNKSSLAAPKQARLHKGSKK